MILTCLTGVAALAIAVPGCVKACVDLWAWRKGRSQQGIGPGRSDPGRCEPRGTSCTDAITATSGVQPHTFEDACDQTDESYAEVFALISRTKTLRLKNGRTCDVVEIEVREDYVPVCDTFGPAQALASAAQASVPEQST